MKQLQFFALAAVALTAAFLSTSCPSPIKLFDKVEETVQSSNPGNLKVPESPTGFVAKALGSDSISLSWSSTKGTEAAYEFERKMEATGTFRSVRPEALTEDASGFIDVDLRSLTTYYYRMRTTSSAGSSEWVTAFASTSQLSAPLSFLARPKQPGGVTLEWKDASDGEDGFAIERSLVQGGSYIESLVGPVSENSTTAFEAEASPRTEYFYRIRAFDAGGVSEWTYSPSVTTYPRCAYLAGMSKGLTIADISDPSDCKVLLSGLLMGVGGVAVHGDYAYATSSTCGLRILDISDPTDPTSVGTCSAISNYSYAVNATGDYVFAAGEWGFAIVDTTDKANPTITGTCPTLRAKDLIVISNYAYIADSNAGLRIIDISDKSSPVIVATCNTSGCAENLASASDLIYVADIAGMRVVDVSVPTSPQILGEWETDGEAWSVAIDLPYAYVANTARSLTVLDVSDPTELVYTRSVHLKEVGQYDFVFDLAVSDGWTYAAGELGVKLINNPSNPTAVYHFSILGGVREVTIP